MNIREGLFTENSAAVTEFTDSSYNRDISGVRTTIQRLGNASQQQETINAFKEESNIRLIAESYKFILWSILAILAVMAVIKLKEKFIEGGEEESITVSDIVGSFRKGSYPVVATGLPERSYPQRLWNISVLRNSNGQSGNGDYDGNRTADWFGEPLPCVLSGIVVKHADFGDPIVRFLPDLRSSAILLGLNFTEFETGTYVPEANATWSKSEISDYYFGYGG
jgi:hypothetical protein